MREVSCSCGSCAVLVASRGVTLCDAARCAAARPGVFASLQSILLLMSAAVRVQRVHLLVQCACRSL